MKDACPLHIALHGCGGNAEDVAELYGPMAAKRGVVMLFPQCSRDCWDYQAKTGPDYNNRNSSEMKAFVKMITKLKEPRSPTALASLVQQDDERKKIDSNYTDGVNYLRNVDH